MEGLSSLSTPVGEGMSSALWVMASATAVAVPLFCNGYFLPGTIGCPRSPLQKKVNELAKRMGVATPIRVVEQDLFPWAAHGAVLYGKGAITVPNAIFHPNPNAVTGILAHELAHIKHNDWVRIVLILPAIATVVSAVLLPLNLPQLVETLLWIVGVCLPLQRVLINRESQADDEALRYLSYVEKRALMNDFDKIRRERLEWRNEKDLSSLSRFIRKCRVTSTGEVSLLVRTHPTLSSRIEKIRRSMGSPSWRDRVQCLVDGMRRFVAL